jgi:hypothetical protein
MNNPQHPIVPPPELVQQWDIEGRHQDYCTVASHIAGRAAQWGADTELEACCEWLQDPNLNVDTYKLRAARRPKSLSLKEQALQVLASAPGPDYPRVMTVLNADEHALICQALEALPND